MQEQNVYVLPEVQGSVKIILSHSLETAFIQFKNLHSMRA